MTYEVEVPIAGYMCIEVEANSQEEAINLAMSKKWDNDDVVELQKYEKFFTGNVSHLYHTEIEVDEV